MGKVGHVVSRRRIKTASICSIFSKHWYVTTLYIQSMHIVCTHRNIHRYGAFSCCSTYAGFYFVRNNAKTQFFFGMLLRMGDVMQRSKSHQSVLNDLIQHFASWKGLRVKTFPKDGLFPGGAEFHNNKSYMRELVLEKSKEYYIFHMSWTENKENKKKFLEQLGEWYTVEDTDDVLCSGIDCCLSTPNITCHYNDKPSKIPCNFSPSIDKNREPFW